MNSPKVSVILPTFNNEPYLKESITSLLNQTFRDFELIIIDDCSADNTPKLLQEFRDKRIQIIRNSENFGVAKSLNLGWKIAKGEYIARADADDIYLPDRLKKQVNFLNTHSDYVLVGSLATRIDEKNEIIGDDKLVETDKQIKKSIWKQNPILHPSVMIRKNALDKVGGYKEWLNGAEDYDLWFSLMRIGKLYNLPDKLMRRRMHKQAVTSRNRISVEAKATIVRLINLPLIRVIGLDVIVGLFSFLLYRWWLNYEMFKGRVVPPEPDDAYFYLYAADLFPQVNNFEQYRLFLYSGWIKLLSIFTNNNLEVAFHLNFYIGLFLLFIALIYFLRKIEDNVLHRVLLISFLGLFSGTGAYHGFYWVVPSFYQLLFFFLILSQLLNNQRLLWYPAVFFTVMHPSSLLISVVFLIYPVLLLLIKKSEFINQLKKSILVFLVIIITYIIYAFVGLRFPQSNVYTSPTDIFTFVQSLLTGNFDISSWYLIWKEYFSFIFLHPVITFGFSLCLVLNWWLNKTHILAFYLATVALVLISSLHPYGYRTLGFLWPITFIIIAYGYIGLYNLLQRYSARIAVFFAFFLLVSFYLTMTSFNLIWIKSVNNNNNYLWDKECPKRIATSGIKTPVIFLNLEAYHAFQLFNLPESKGRLLIQDEKINQDNIYVQKEPFTPSGDNLNKFEQWLSSLTTRREKYPDLRTTSHSWTALSQDAPSKVTWSTVVDCGQFDLIKESK